MVTFFKQIHHSQGDKIANLYLFFKYLNDVYACSNVFLGRHSVHYLQGKAVFNDIAWIVFLIPIMWSEKLPIYFREERYLISVIVNLTGTQLWHIPYNTFIVWIVIVFNITNFFLKISRGWTINVFTWKGDLRFL